MVEQSTAASRHLAEQATYLAQLVGGFRTGATPGANGGANGGTRMSLAA